MKRSTAAARYTAELVGTFFVVVTIGCNLHAGSIGAALSVGSVLMAMVCSLGTVSGGHFNPAVTLAVWLSGRGGMRLGEVLCYMVCQILGGILGTLTYWGVLGKELRRGPTFPYSLAESFYLETIYTWALCYVFLNVVMAEGKASQSGFHRPLNGIAVGCTVTAAVIAIGPISGCSLNPAVTLGSYSVTRLLPASSHLTLCCPYTFAPFVGSILGAMSFFLVRGGASGQYLTEEDDWQPEDIARYLAQDAPARLPPTPRVVRMHPEDKGPPPWSFCMRKQEPVTLPDALVGHRLFCGLRWRMKESLGGAAHRHAGTTETCDIDLSCVKFARGGECLGAVYFHDKGDLDNDIHHSGDEVAGRAGLVDNELITMRLSDVRPDVHALVFTMTVYSSGQSFADIAQCYARLVDMTDDSREYCRWERASLLPGNNGLIVAMLYRSGCRWCFKAVDESFSIPANSSYRKLVPQMSDCVLQTSTGPTP